LSIGRSNETTDRVTSAGLARFSGMAPHSDALTETLVLRLVQQLSVGHPTHWVAVQEVAERTDLQRDVVDAVVRKAVGRGCMLAEGEPPHRVTLRPVGGRPVDLADFRRRS